MGIVCFIQTNMKKILFAAGFLSMIACQQTTKQTADLPLTYTALINQGKYLVSVTGCNDCHTSKIMTDKGPALDSNLLLAGHPAALSLPAADPMTSRNWALFHFNGTAVKGPWGTSFAANLTPDSTGIGMWTEAQFIRAFQHGDAKGLAGNRKLLPPMPWQAYQAMKPEDVRAIFAYLKSIPPVKNVVPEPIAPQP